MSPGRHGPAGRVVLVLASVLAGLVGFFLVRRGRRRQRGGIRVPAADAFFLHVESASAPQHVGGVVLLDTSSRPGGPPTREEVEARVRSVLGELPRFHQRLDGFGRWQRPRWLEQPDLDWGWHVPLVTLNRPDGSTGGRRAFEGLVAELASQQLPRDRPLWRLVVVHGVDDGVSAVVLLVHHVIADGIGTVAQALRLLTPELPSQTGPPPPGPLRRALGVVVGLAQLATDGRPRDTLPSSGTAERGFATMQVPMPIMRQIARRHAVRVSDVLLCTVAEAVRRCLLTAGRRPPAELRVSVPLMVRDPRDQAEGNVTGAVLVDLPMGELSVPQRLATIAARTSRLRSPSRAVASRFVMTSVGRVFPPPVHAWFARTVYGNRFFSGIVSNMPGPDGQLFLVGAPLAAAFPLLPLAPGVPFVVGTLGWNGTFCVSIATDPGLVDDADVLASSMRAALTELGT